LWAQYVQLTEAEVAFLGYVLWVTLKHTLKRAV
jgi:hypothetical protein